MKFDINIKEISYIKDDFDSTSLLLSIYGKDISYSIINSLRKVCINQIPIYAFITSKINITRNNSVYDNSEMKLRLSQLPIKNLKHNVINLSLKYYKNINFADPKYEKHPDDINIIEIFIKAKNVGPDRILNVSTNDVKISINNEIINNNKMYSEKYPILLIKLRAGEEFECSLKGVLATGELDSIFNASNSYYEEIDPNKYNFYVESNGQLSEYELILRGIDIIIEKIKIIKENVNQNQYKVIITDNKSMIIEILNEDHTCAGPINHILQNMKEVIFSGVSKPDFLQKNILIKFKVDNDFNPIDIFNIAVDNTIDLYNNIKNIALKLI